MDHKTILTTTETELEIKKSRFIGRVVHVEDEASIETILNEVRKVHYKATHVCFAYVLAPTDAYPIRQKASDAGEPSGTAGKPMLEVLNAHELQNVLVIVIRYFGGIKLGAGGLVRAYAGTVSQVLESAPITFIQTSDVVKITVDYPAYGSLMNKLSSKKITPVSEDFGEKVGLTFYLPVAETDDFIAWVRDITNDRFEWEMVEQKEISIQIS